MRSVALCEVEEKQYNRNQFRLDLKEAASSVKQRRNNKNNVSNGLYGKRRVLFTGEKLLQQK